MTFTEKMIVAVSIAFVAAAVAYFVREALRSRRARLKKEERERRKQEAAQAEMQAEVEALEAQYGIVRDAVDRQMALNADFLQTFSQLTNAMFRDRFIDR